MTSPDARLDRSISIHALREEGDFGIRPERQRVNLFLSTPSARRATTSSKNKRTNDKNFYPRPPRGGRRGEFCRAGKSYGISIHALREEGDIEPEAGEKKQEISIHALREEGDLVPLCRAGDHQAISIHALREEGDGCWQAPCWPHQYFYPRPPRGGRRHLSKINVTVGQFLSTPSARRATKVSTTR